MTVSAKTYHSSKMVDNDILPLYSMLFVLVVKQIRNSPYHSRVTHITTFSLVNTYPPISFQRVKRPWVLTLILTPICVCLCARAYVCVYMPVYQLPCALSCCCLPLASGEPASELSPLCDYPRLQLFICLFQYGLSLAL